MIPHTTMAHELVDAQKSRKRIRQRCSFLGSAFRVSRSADVARKEVATRDEKTRRSKANTSSTADGGVVVGSLDWFQRPLEPKHHSPARAQLFYPCGVGKESASRIPQDLGVLVVQHPHWFLGRGRSIRLMLKASRRLFRMIADCDFASLKARADRAGWPLYWDRSNTVGWSLLQGNTDGLHHQTDRYQDADMEPGKHVESIVARQQERNHARPCCCRFWYSSSNGLLKRGRPALAVEIPSLCTSIASFHLTSPSCVTARGIASS